MHYLFRLFTPIFRADFEEVTPVLSTNLFQKIISYLESSQTPILVL